jgi:hypothetical protein
MTPRHRWPLLRAALVLLVVLAVPSGAAIATGDRFSPVVSTVVSPATPYGGEHATVAGAPAGVAVSSIQFATDRGTGNTPINEGTRFRFGPRGMYVFFDYRDVNPGDRVKFVFQLVDPPIDINYGEIVLEGRSGRASAFLERQDRDYLMLGRFDCTIRTLDDIELGRASFEIVDDGGDGGGDNRNDNSDNGNENSDNGNESSDNGNVNDNVGDNGNLNSNDNA